MLGQLPDGREIVSAEINLDCELTYTLPDGGTGRIAVRLTGTPGNVNAEMLTQGEGMDALVADQDGWHHADPSHVKTLIRNLVNGALDHSTEGLTS
jgi:hypothetical protein